MTLLDVVAEHARSVSWGELTDAERSATKRLVVDSVAVAIAAADAEVIQRLERGLGSDDEQSGDRVRVIGRRPQPVDTAMMLNAALVRQLDLMDVFWAKDVCHPSENIPIALTMGAASHASGRKVLEATVAGYDAQVALCRLMSFSEIGMHHVSAAGVAIPALLTSLLDLEPVMASHAAAIAAYRSYTLGALSRGELSNAKSFSYGLAAMEARRAIQLAGAGLTGPAQSLDWLLHEVAGIDVGPAELRAALGASVTSTAMKRYPVQFALQGPVEAAANLSSELGDLSDEAALPEVIVRVPSWTVERTVDPAKLAPTNRETADHSLPISVAMALLDGDVTAGAMLSGRWADPDVVALSRRIYVEEDGDLAAANPGGGPGAVQVVIGDGTRRSVQVEYPLGDPRRPMSDADLLAKFEELVSPSLGTDQSAELWSRLIDLDNEPDVLKVLELTVPRASWLTPPA